MVLLSKSDETWGLKKTNSLIYQFKMKQMTECVNFKCQNYQIKVKMSLWHLRNLTEFSSPFSSVFCSDFYRICVFYSHLKPTVAYLDLNLPTTADRSLSQSVSPAHSPIHPFLGVICAHQSASHSLSAQLMNLSWGVRFPPAWLQLSRLTAERSDGSSYAAPPVHH